VPVSSYLQCVRPCDGRCKLVLTSPLFVAFD
jgi:hypothetical protein